jgi:D-psicose/D-tagatose/L-ribulose 3-epimerase
MVPNNCTRRRVTKLDWKRNLRFSLCNEVIADRIFGAQCELAASLGYMGLEVAPFTLSDEPHLLSPTQAAVYRREAEVSGIEITGLHWLLITPKGLSVTTPDPAVRARTIDVLERLIGLCAAMGGSVLVHGSPAQRAVPPGETREVALDRAMEVFAAIAAAAAREGVTYCLEPLARRETDFVNTVAEAVEIVDLVSDSAFRTMIDTSAAGATETETVPTLINTWLPTGKIAHVQVNDRNRRGPGQGSDTFAPILGALRHNDYDGVVAVEPFDYIPDGPTTAARAIGYLQGCLEHSD